MADLIDREALLWEYKTNNKYSANAASLAQCIHDAPTFDAVEVVRCIDCEWYRKYDGICCPLNQSGFTDDGIMLPLENDFCSYGVRKKHATD